MGRNKSEWLIRDRLFDCAPLHHHSWPEGRHPPSSSSPPPSLPPSSPSYSGGDCPQDCHSERPGNILKDFQRPWNTLKDSERLSNTLKYSQLGGDPGWPGSPRFSFCRLEIARLSRRSMSSAGTPNHLGSAFTGRGDPHASSRPWGGGRDKPCFAFFLDFCFLRFWTRTLYVGSFALAWSPSQGGDMAVAAIYLQQHMLAFAKD